MKIAICLNGVSYGKNIGETNTDRTWKESNIKESIIDPLKENHEVSTYLTTYLFDGQGNKNEEIFNLIDYYNPVKTTLLPFKGSNQRSTYAKGLEVLLYEDIDFIISTRFDIQFFKKITEYDIDFNKVNFLFREGPPWWNRCMFVTDNFFGIPKLFLPSFIGAIRYDNRTTYDMHTVYATLRYFLGEEVLHFLSNDQEYSDSNSHYILPWVHIKNTKPRPVDKD